VLMQLLWRSFSVDTGEDDVGQLCGPIVLPNAALQWYSQLIRHVAKQPNSVLMQLLWRSFSVEILVKR